VSAEALTEPSSSSLDLAPCGLIRLDRHFRIQTANRYAHRLSGRAAEEPLDGLGFNDLLSIASRIFAQTRLWPELALAGAVEEMALDLVRPDGDRVPVLLNALQSVDDAGGPGDIHIALVRAAAQRPHAAEARRARAAAEQAGRAKSDFLANVSHEIRTPLNGIIGVTGALERTELTPQQREMVQLIQSSGGMLERLVSDVLELSKVEAGGLQLEVRPFDLGLELRSVLDLSQIRADEKGLGFRVELADDVRGMVTGDSVRLKQILGNLLSNAVKFTESGEVRVSIGFERGEAGADVLAMSITDTGQGFDQATADTLFQRFQQADTGITRRFGGTGLGLAICKALLELMGGSIEVQSIPGRAAASALAFPCPARRRPPARPSRPARPTKPSRSCASCWWRTTPPTRRWSSSCSCPTASTWSGPSTARSGCRPGARAATTLCSWTCRCRSWTA
jgi:signal transduction histidine kinase